MENHGKVQRLIVAIILNIVVLAFFVAVSNLTYAQFHTAIHEKTLYEITKYSSLPIAHIAVGEGPKAIGADDYAGRIYVANYDGNTVSVINTTDNTKLGKDIPVGKGPSAIDVDTTFNNRIYVLNQDDNTISVLDPEHLRYIETIPHMGGVNPSAIYVDDDNNRTYVTSYQDGTVSVLDTHDLWHKIKDIPVGKGPDAMASGERCTERCWPIIYVANYDDNTLSVVDTTNNTKLGKDIPVGKGPSAMVSGGFFMLPIMIVILFL
ncbi:MAG: YncE family protein [Candidatus Nitrosopolaris sp.]